MIVCLLGDHSSVSRLFTFACLIIVVVVHFHLVLVDGAPGVIKSFTTSPVLNDLSTIIPINNTNNNYNNNNDNNDLWTTTADCKEETIDRTLPFFSLPYRIFAGVLIVPITVCAISGNILVIYVIKHYHALRITGNVFLASLAVADVGVSTLAMTFYGLQLLLGRWVLGPFMCRLWFSCDVLFSTASIIHLTGISLDRYLSIVRPFEHERSSSERRRYIMILGCWVVSALLSFIPIFTGIYTTREQLRQIDCLRHVRGRCIFAVNQVYAIVSSSFSFWVPGAIMVIIYGMLIRIADRKEKEAHRMMGAVAHRRRASQPNQIVSRRRSSDEQTLAEPPATGASLQRSHQLATAASNGCFHPHSRRSGQHDSIDTQMDRHASVDLPGNILDPRNSQMKHLRREFRAVKTLGAIMFAFLLCWLPFFLRYTLCEPNRCQWKYMPIVEDIVFWVGYFNSMINPFLYAFHNRDFLRAFQRTLSPYVVCCRQRRASTSSAIPLPPATPSAGDMQRTGSKKRKTKAKKNSRSKSDINEQQTAAVAAAENAKMLVRGNTILDASNGNLTSGENSTSSKRNSCL